jgi:hypothetical protein
VVDVPGGEEVLRCHTQAGGGDRSVGAGVGGSERAALFGDERVVRGEFDVARAEDVRDRCAAVLGVPAGPGDRVQSGREASAEARLVDRVDRFERRTNVGDNASLAIDRPFRTPVTLTPWIRTRSAVSSVPARSTVTRSMAVRYPSTVSGIGGSEALATTSPRRTLTDSSRSLARR